MRRALRAGGLHHFAYSGPVWQWPLFHRARAAAADRSPIGMGFDRGPMVRSDGLAPTAGQFLPASLLQFANSDVHPNVLTLPSAVRD